MVYPAINEKPALVSNQRREKILSTDLVTDYGHQLASLYVRISKRRSRNGEKKRGLVQYSRAVNALSNWSTEW